MHVTYTPARLLTAVDADGEVKGIVHGLAGASGGITSARGGTGSLRKDRCSAAGLLGGCGSFQEQ